MKSTTPKIESGQPIIYINLEETTGIEGFIAAIIQVHRVVMRVVLNKHTSFENMIIFNAMHDDKSAIEDEIDEKLNWVGGADGTACIIETVLKIGGLDDKSK